MVPQSRAPTVLLTRPVAQSARFATALLARFPWVRTVISPLMSPEFLNPILPQRNWGGVIFTSETGVLAAKRIAADGYAMPERTFCVGDQTAAVADACGFRTASAQGDGMALVRLVQAANVVGPLLYLHGAERRADVGGALNMAGIETVSAVCYAQKPQHLTPEAIAVLRQDASVATPVFSARTGTLLAREYMRIAGSAPLLVAAISADVGVDLAVEERRIALWPDAAAMIDAMAFWLA
ncbi:MAG: uroporphyrinogen-III synthase [Pseudorhodobacter sp.]|nr:uroporphyrinogen-III synthase [Pseudorhodobacter sp.]